MYATVRRSRNGTANRPAHLITLPVWVSYPRKSRWQHLSGKTHRAEMAKDRKSKSDPRSPRCTFPPRLLFKPSFFPVCDPNVANNRTWRSAQSARELDPSADADISSHSPTAALRDPDRQPEKKGRHNRVTSTSHR